MQNVNSTSKTYEKNDHNFRDKIIFLNTTILFGRYSNGQ